MLGYPILAFRKPGSFRFNPFVASRGRVWVRLVAVLLVSALALGGLVGAWLWRPLTWASTPLEVEIEAGRTPRQIAQALVDAGVQTSPAWLYQWFRWSGKSARIRAGSYELSGSLTPIQLLDKLVSGDETLARVRFIEGWNFRQLRQALASAPGLKSETADLDEVALMARIGSPGLPAEGQFFPDTYTYARGSSDLAVLRRAHQAMKRHLELAWSLPREDGMPLQSAQDLLVLASIVEKETGRPEDRAKIARVFLNRLRIGMPLQTDPTVIYGLGAAFDGNLRRAHLQTDGPFNTYTRRGLPPTPIALPGRAALDAVVRAEPGRALYFVARGDGTSEFSDTLDAHNRAVQRYQLQRSRKTP